MHTPQKNTEFLSQILNHLNIMGSVIWWNNGT